MPMWTGRILDTWFILGVDRFDKEIISANRCVWPEHLMNFVFIVRKDRTLVGPILSSGGLATKPYRGRRTRRDLLTPTDFLVDDPWPETGIYHWAARIRRLGNDVVGLQWAKDSTQGYTRGNKDV